MPTPRVSCIGQNVRISLVSRRLSSPNLLHLLHHFYLSFYLTSRGYCLIILSAKRTHRLFTGAPVNVTRSRLHRSGEDAPASRRPSFRPAPSVTCGWNVHQHRGVCPALPRLA